ncbi:MAG: hypothetical protein HGB00_06070 [Chlorobiaceae bacterium]|nr:hypothetical protein [Chlorobiaceae bacterium]
MVQKYEIGDDYFSEKILAAVFLGFRTVSNPSSVTVHPDLMKKIRANFRNKMIGPKLVGDVEVFCGLKVIEDATMETDHISVS